MADNDLDDLATSWSEKFLPARLFSTFGMALFPTTRLLLCLACVLICYSAGRVLDWVWLSADAGVTVSAEGERVQTEIAAHATMSSRDFATWLLTVADANRRFEIETVYRLTGAESKEAAEALLEGASARSLIEAELEKEPVKLVDLVAQLREAGLAAIDGDTESSAADKQRRRDALKRAADYFQFIAAGRDTDRYFTPTDAARAADDLVSADTTLEVGPRNDAITRLRKFVLPQRRIAELERRRPQGPFRALMAYEINAFSAAVDGTCAFRFGFAGNAMSVRPSMLGSLGSAAEGVLWLATQRPWYAIVLAVIILATFSFFGGAACRMAAIQAARQEHIALRTALRFSCEKFLSLLFVPVVPLGIFVSISALIVVGGMVAAIPFVGEILAGLFYFMALLGGLALALLLIGGVLGFGLMWPTIAVEGSDSFDATARSFGYVGQRTWLAAYYSVVLLVFGGISLVMVRLIAMVTLKLTHSMTDLGMSMFGMVHSASTDTFTKLEAMWQMPAWADLTLIPSTRSASFWGAFGGVPLGTG